MDWTLIAGTLSASFERRAIAGSPLARTLLLSVLIFSAAGCADVKRSDTTLASTSSPAHSPEQCMAGAEIQAASENTDYLIQPGDQLDISFYLNSEFDDSVIVRPDGKISLRVIGEVRAADLTPDRLAEQLDQAYSGELRAPGATVHVKNMPGRTVYIDGQVAKAGSFPLAPGMTAIQAVADAGGLTPEASKMAVLIRRDACGTLQGIKINLKAAVDSPSSEEDIALMPRDVIIVPRSTIANLNLIVDQYVKKMIPVNPYMGLPF